MIIESYFFRARVPIGPLVAGDPLHQLADE
jgi:hypothetical protein